MQHELLPRVAAEVSYNRRWWGNAEATDNQLAAPTDYDRFTVPAPLDSRLPGGGGYQIADLFDLNPAKVGQVGNFVTNASNLASRTEYWHGVDVNVTIRASSNLRFQGGTSTGRRVLDTCEIRALLPESAPVNPYCHQVLPFQTQVRGVASYVIPKVDILLSGIFQHKPGAELAANWNVPNAVIVPSLGRNLSGGAQFATVNLLQPGDRFGDTVNQIDLKIAKIFRFGTTRTNLGVDLYNLSNSAAVIGYNQTYSPTATTWLTPTSVLPARFARLTVQFDF